MIFVARGLLKQGGDKVHQGPFRGMTMIYREQQMISAFLPRLLGFYEQELHGAIEAAIARAYGAVVTIGCAEGYYSVGLARRMPVTRHYAFDIDAHAQELCRESAVINGVADHLFIGGECDHAMITKVVSEHDSTFLVVDCEGAEGTLLDPALCPALRQADMLVECHEFLDPGLTDRLIQRFAETHVIERIDQGGRNPLEIPFLHERNEIDRWMVVMEGRPRAMWWLIMKARAKHEI